MWNLVALHLHHQDHWTTLAFSLSNTINPSTHQTNTNPTPQKSIPDPIANFHVLHVFPYFSFQNLNSFFQPSFFTLLSLIVIRTRRDPYLTVSPVYMRKFFRKIDRSLSVSHDPTWAPPRRASLPAQVETSLLYSTDQARQRANSTSDGHGPWSGAHNDRGNIDGLDDVASLRSVALSESETLALSEPQHFELQSAYQDNYTAYLPYLLRRLRLAHQRAAEGDGVAEGRASIRRLSTAAVDPNNNDDDDDRTVALCDTGNLIIMDRHMTTYNCKQSLIVVSEMLKNSTYVFPCQESYALFKELRLGRYRLREKRRNSVIVYDNNCNISRVTGASPDAVLPGDPDIVVDRRHHLIPLEYKIKGSGLPLFKVSVPYMSSIRRNTPFMVFRKYREIPEKPAVTPADDDEHFETYDFCQVYTKIFQPYKRYTFQFSPAGGPKFTVYAFQNNFRPFTDFTYKNTRFRILGTLLGVAYIIAYNPELKLFILDDLQPSLADDLVEKENRHELFTRVRNQANASGNESCPPVAQSENHPTTFTNPVPRSNNPIVLDAESHARAYGQTFIPNDSPPFARFIDSFVYQKSGLLLPKRFSEVGKVEVYQDPEGLRAIDPHSTYAVELDLAVLTTILLTLREANIRMAKRQHTTFSSRMSVFNSFPLPGQTNFLGSVVM